MAKEKYENSQAQEIEEINNLSNQIEKIQNGTIVGTRDYTPWTKYKMNENGYIIGQEEIDLPQNFNELYIKVTMNNIRVYEYTIIKDALTETTQYWYNGLGNDRTNYVTLSISKTKFILNNAYFNSTELVTTAKTEIWYR